MSTFFESVPNGTLGFQIQKQRIWIESIESFLRVGAMDSKSFFGFPQRNRKSIFRFEIRIWILTKGTHPVLFEILDFKGLRQWDARLFGPNHSKIGG